jgi:hypothetical protein
VVRLLQHGGGQWLGSHPQDRVGGVPLAACGVAAVALCRCGRLRQCFDVLHHALLIGSHRHGAGEADWVSLLRVAFMAMQSHCRTAPELLSYVSSLCAACDAAARGGVPVAATCLAAYKQAMEELAHTVSPSVFAQLVSEEASLALLLPALRTSATRQQAQALLREASSSAAAASSSS